METGWQVGRGVADVTGEPWGVAMMGYGMPDQRTNGILSRQYARAFVVDDGARRVVFLVADIGMFFQAAVTEIHQRLRARYGDTYGPHNVVLTATHTHCGPGGHGHDMLYNITTLGFHQRTFERLVAGVMEAIDRAHHDVAPATLMLNHGVLIDASVNRARAAFDRDPGEERAFFPEGVDSTTTLLRFERDGRLVGAINWFAVHNTSMTNRNCLISADNKGWAAYEWEHCGADPQGPDAELVTAFAQTNAGDLSPNLDLRPGAGPTDDERQNTRAIGDRQLDAARALAAREGEPLACGIDVRHRYLRLADASSAGGRTGRAILGASFAAGKLTDGPGSPLFDEGKRNPVPERVSRWLYRAVPGLERAHAPKDLFLPIGRLRWAQETFLLQLVRWGELHLICLPFEVTVVAGLRLRRDVAAVLGTDLDHVLLQGYANGYGHYVTTPEEYDEQLYEGGSTVFGRHQLDALRAAVRQLATSMRDGTSIDPGAPPRPHRLRLTGPTGSPRFARSQPVAVRQAPGRARSGETVTAVFDTGHPNAANPATHLRVERLDGDTWRVVADDASPSTTIRWRRDRWLRFTAEVTWIAEPGTHRITHVGPAEASTPPFTVA